MTLENMNNQPDASKEDEVPQQEEISPKEALIRSLGKDFSSYTSDGNFVVYIKFCHDRNEVEDDIRNDTFYPDFVHQFFVDQERIFGYKKPIVRLFYTASRLKRYINFDYEDKLTKEKDGIDADDVVGYLSPILEDDDYTKDLNQFIKEVTSKEELEFRPPGDLLHEFEVNYKKPVNLSRAQRELLEEVGELGIKISYGGEPSIEGNGTSSNGASSSHDRPELNPLQTVVQAKSSSETTKKRFQIICADVASKNFNSFQARMQTLVMWFIESANMIDFEDPRWDCFLIFERYNPSYTGDSGATSISTEDKFYFAGYATVYRYYAYPDRTRPRVSQMLILPPYKRNGLGTALLQSIYNYYKKQPATLDMTAEDPDEEFISMRDLLDCKNCSALESFQPEKLKQGWSEEMAKESQERLKLCRRQARKVYEILKLKITDKSDEEEYKQYRLEIKNRLNIPNQKQRIDVDRAMKRDPKVHIPDELKPQDKVTAAKLEDNYRLLEKQYQHIIDKMNQSKSLLTS